MCCIFFVFYKSCVVYSLYSIRVLQYIHCNYDRNILCILWEYSGRFFLINENTVIYSQYSMGVYEILCLHTKVNFFYSMRGQQNILCILRKCCGYSTLWILWKNHGIFSVLNESTMAYSLHSGRVLWYILCFKWEYCYMFSVFLRVPWHFPILWQYCGTYILCIQ